MENNGKQRCENKLLMVAGYLLPDDEADYKLFNSVFPSLATNVRSGIDVEGILSGKPYSKGAVKSRSISLQPQDGIQSPYALVASKKTPKQKKKK